jgi:hypothetical protein
MIYLAVTADYELFLGVNYAGADEVLFEPTRQLLALAQQHHVPITLFADVCSVWAHRHYALDLFADKFEAQLKEAVQHEHDVQLHLHPHWELASYQSGEWCVPEASRFHLSEMPNAANLITRGRLYLESLLRPIAPAYRCVAFRAAGLALQPSERTLIGNLVRAGLFVDSSIAKGYTLKTDTLIIDYKKCPSLPNWWLTEQTGLQPGEPPGLFEVPIATFELPLADRVMFLVRRALRVGRRRGAPLSRSRRRSRLSHGVALLAGNARYFGYRPKFLFSADTKGFTAKMLLRGFHDYISAYDTERSVYVSMILHPKLLFSEQLEILSTIFKCLRRTYREQLEFVTLAQVARQVSSVPPVVDA